MLTGGNRPWLLVVDWSITPFTGASEPEDVDVSVLACDIPACAATLERRWSDARRRPGR